MAEGEVRGPRLEAESVGGRGGPAPAVPATQPRPRAAAASLYRPQAVEARRYDGTAAEPLRIAPAWASWIVLLGAALVIAAVVAACISRVEVTSVGRGILQANGAPQVIATQIDGVIVSVAVKAGDTIVAGQELARLESTSTSAALLEATRRLELAERALSNFRDRKKPLYDARQAHQRAQIRALGQRAASERSSVARKAGKAQSMEALKDAGLVTPFDSLEAAEGVATTEREALRTQEEDARIRDQISALDANTADEQWQLVMRVEEARLQHDSLKFAVDAAIVRAPLAGVVGSLSVRPGDRLQAGSPLGRVVTAGAPRTVVAYLPERDRAFVELGAKVRVELDQLPVWEFGALGGRVTRVATEMASERDLRENLGDQLQIQEPLYRVEVAIDRDERYEKLAHRLRPESLSRVRFTLRERTVITVLFEPLQRWLR